MRALALCLLGALAFGAAVAPAAVAQGETAAASCPTEDGSYPVTAPAEGTQVGSGGDPAAEAAVNCQLGYHEKEEYPLSLIAVCLLFTAATLILVHRRRDHYSAGSGA